MSNEFKLYLEKKKISAESFKANEPEEWKAWAKAFELLHPESFTAQKLFLINGIRRKYPLKVETDTPLVDKPVARPKPRFTKKTSD